MKKGYDSDANSSMSSDVKEMFLNWRLVFHLGIVELQNRYKKSFLGPLWSVLNPFFTACIVYFVFGGAFSGYLPGRSNYFFWVFSGFILIVFIVQGISLTTNLIISNLRIVLNYRMNPALVAFSVAFSQTLNFLAASLIVVMLNQFINLSVSYKLLYLPILALLICIFLSGMGMFLLNYFLRFEDASHFFGLIMMVVTYLSPFFYPFDILTKPLIYLVSFNPITSFILVYRWILLPESTIAAWRIIFVIMFSIIVFIIGLKSMKNKWNETVML